MFPSELKLAKVVPLFKSGDSSQITNYRPISILSFFSKIFERIMYNHIVDFMDSNCSIYISTSLDSDRDTQPSRLSSH